MPGPADRQPVQLLWTGGWDSSFRLMQALLVEDRAVQPFYVLSPGRDSAVHEVRAMATMRSGLLERLGDPDRLAPTQVVVGTDYPPSAELVQHRESILRRGWLGEQYLMLAGVADALGWEGVEMSIKANPGSVLDRVAFDRDGGLKDLPESRLFRYWSFPIMHWSTARMTAVAEDHAFLDLLEQRWFCHQPLLDRPCGRCRPCRLANVRDVQFANPALAAARAAQRRLARWRYRSGVPR